MPDKVGNRTDQVQPGVRLQNAVCISRVCGLNITHTAISLTGGLVDTSGGVSQKALRLYEHLHSTT
jgi:hypothetical protein